MKYVDQFYEFLIQTFLFIPKEIVQANINASLNDTQYYIVMIGIWIVLIVVMWFSIWMFFKFASFC